VVSRQQVLPGKDPEVAAALEEEFLHRGVRLLIGARAVGIDREGDGVAVRCNDGRVARGSHALIAIGSVPNSEGLGLEDAGVDVDARGYVPVNQHCQSNLAHVYAAGDVSGRLPLSSVAAMQGRKIAEHVMGLQAREHRHLDYDKKVKPGDEVDAAVTQDMKTQSGEVIVPKDTKVIGHVTEAQTRNKEQKESQIGISFDHAVMKGGEVALPMSIQAIIAPPAVNGASNNGGGESTGNSPSAGYSGGTSRGSNGGRAGNTGTPQSSTPSANSDEGAKDTGAHQPITGNTQGVVGFPDLKLSTTADSKQGSLVSSEKNNVKLESGTLMLLRVNQ
jgi:hypothetical protein